MTQRQALVLGATGGIGGEVARTLVKKGWHVRALARRPGQRGDFEWLRGDVMNEYDVVQAATGVELIVHAVNPPGYQRWADLVLPMIDHSITAAERSGARILLPGTVYNYGPQAFPLLTEASPQSPTTKKGALRVELELRLKAAVSRKVRTLIVRAGDFFGPQAGNSWFSQGVVKAGQPVTRIVNPGTKGVGHQWAYVPDLAMTMVRLIEEVTLADFETYHFEGYWDADGLGMAAAINRVLERPVKVTSFPWWLVALAWPVVPFFKELRELRYLWRTPIRLDNARLLRALGSEPRTPLDEAVRVTLESQHNLG